jgi:hypothetical protein
VIAVIGRKKQKLTMEAQRRGESKRIGSSPTSRVIGKGALTEDGHGSGNQNLNHKGHEGSQRKTGTTYLRFARIIADQEKPRLL